MASNSSFSAAISRRHRSVVRREVGDNEDHAAHSLAYGEDALTFYPARHLRRLLASAGRTVKRETTLLESEDAGRMYSLAFRRGD
ncbi:hypothetical protein MBEHAL_1685 [Halarchaeum acidiphilum MH1-52-1]|uniref:Uncharacterized protein n=1 Tax=Halarchaeum acidiphilum MH1-52-1 TaxID=1261545 RepID=U2YV79_9EURY|nr:hypothetical protein [Halarchaeum acidiphilum]GAD52925.1 hypothetical protein MBEHAL_1685 [Halarchaeum acidiphilum MH1-52-1]